MVESQIDEVKDQKHYEDSNCPEGHLLLLTLVLEILKRLVCFASSSATRELCVWSILSVDLFIHVVLSNFELFVFHYY